uniref:Multiple epidermal growth factor-like domains protein 10 n=1 Tax=Crassostrea virginica TaxID=6565 RepID=A0A8B8C5P5_CRAVI|nr:multiple epidermal growth factor-like domains protein 10 [Crassostrea virginica]
MNQILRLPFIIHVLYGLIFNHTDETSICLNGQTGKRECCQDYRNVSGICKACIGSWGKHCTRNCSFGFYGHGCRYKCNCSLQEICDRREGCIETDASTDRETNFHVLEIGLLFAVGVSILILLVWRGLPYLYRYLTKSPTGNNRTKEINPVKTNSEQLHDQESNYSTIDLRESKFDGFDDSHDSFNPWSRQDSRGPVVSSFKYYPTKSRRMEHTLGEMGYNRVHLKQHHTLQEDTRPYGYCSIECFGPHSQR